MDDTSLIVWCIETFDPTKVPLFPVEFRWYRFDWSKAAPNEARDFKALLDAAVPPEELTPLALGQTIITHSFRRSGVDRRVLRFRHLFVPFDPAGLREPGPPLHRETMGINFDYVEDVQGNEISKAVVIAHATGIPNPIIAHDPASVTALGPHDQRDKAAWTAETADTIAHFLRVVHLLSSSRWNSHPIEVSMVQVGTAPRQIIRAIFPQAQDEQSVVNWFRQLYSSDPADNLFNRACNEYMRFADNESKRVFVKWEIVYFNHSLSQPPMPSKIKDCSARELIDTFFYGANLIHSKSRNDCEGKLASLVNTYTRVDVVMAFHTCLKAILRHALFVAPVLGQDFRYWVIDKRYTGPTHMDVNDLLGRVG